ncbi:hypothetical protein AMD27_07000 [Acinetobacter sp. TGL-Y2]|uniref:hypothetical protein n=1 Tax=Acinetobacter sp. TGL-Y2 TaxID=1407071 RepID=UPI0007A6635A|nr:hypothetical protein [Acinetobacter sp. TGL-Y2]AMW78657.1 hypothetical protein AMD27_07000 [Acinetobacter sp. TGL-Y2]
MPLPSKEQFTGSGVTEQIFKNAQNQLIKYIQEHVATNDKVIAYKTGVNIFDPAKIKIGKYFNYLDGEVGDAASSFVAAGPYQIEGGIEYKTPLNYGQQFAFFDESMKYISGKSTALPSSLFTTPSNAKFIGLTLETNNVSDFMLCKSSEYPAIYVPFELKLDELKLQSEQVEDFDNRLEANLNKLSYYKLNVLDFSKVTPSRYVSYLNGELDYVEGYSVIGPCEIKPNTEYQTSQEYSQQFALYDSNMNFISGMASPPASKKFTTPVNAKFINITVLDSELNTVIFAESSVFADVKDVKDIAFEHLVVKPEQISGLTNLVESTIGLSPLNILDLDKIIPDRYVVYTNGALGYNADYSAAGPYEIKPNTEYQTSLNYVQQFAFYDESMAYLSGMPSPPADKRFITPLNAKYIRLTVGNNQLDKVVIAESAIFPEAYVSSDVKLAKNLIVSGNSSSVKINEIWVSADLNDSDPRVKFKGKNAIQLALDSITDAGPNNRYIIWVKKGLYKITKATEFLGYRGYPAMVLTKDHVDIFGQGENNTIVWAELPYSDADIGPSIDGNIYPREQYQTVYDYADDSEIKDITFIAKNLRYTIHIDNPNGADSTRKYENVGYIFKGDKGSLTAMGCGTSSGERTYITGGRSLSDKNVPFACHNNIAFDKPSYWSFKGHNFTALENVYFAYMQSDGSLLEDQLELIGCSFGGMAYTLGYVQVWLTGNTETNRDSFDHAEWMVTGYGNDPFLFKNDISGQSLLFKSTAVGLSNTVRFNIESSAYSKLIKNNQKNSISSLYIDSREFIDSYIVQDGSPGMPAMAWGCKDLSEMIYLYDNGINYTSLAKRLGDCSVTNLALEVIVNGIAKTIVFNKNYSAMTNAQILAEMNAQITDVTIEFTSYGRDYYPTITDVSEAIYNKTESFIPKGSLVTKQAGYVKLANGNDKVYGVALDDIPVMQVTSEGVKKGQGRVLKHGYIYANRSQAHFVLADNENPALGTRFSVSNGQLVTDINGKISTDIDVGVISINC